MAERAFITCHVLDTASGQPAAGMKVTLTLVAPQASDASECWEGVTDGDGRVQAWEPSDAGGKKTVRRSLGEAIRVIEREGQRVVWRLSFATEEYYGAGRTFWPRVDLTFVTSLAETHYHVPLLLGPWSYTTYRGS